MGLDGVELVMATEDEFGISIPDAVAEKMLTVGSLVDYVYECVNGVSPERDRELRTDLDNRFEKVISQSITDLPLDTKIKDLLTPGREVSQWRKLGIHPYASRPKVALIATFCLISVPTVKWSTQTAFPVLMCFLVVFLAGILTHWLTIPFYQLPSADPTVGEQIWWSTEKSTEPVSRSVIFEKVKYLIVEQLGVEEHQVTDEARFIEDLGIG